MARLAGAHETIIQHCESLGGILAKIAIGHSFAITGELLDRRFTACRISEKVKLLAQAPGMPCEDLGRTGLHEIFERVPAPIEDRFENIAHGKDGRAGIHVDTINGYGPRLAAGCSSFLVYCDPVAIARKAGSSGKPPDPSPDNDDMLRQTRISAIDLYITAVQTFGHMRSETARNSSAWWQKWKLRWVARRNALLANPRFQNWAARNPVLRPIARRKSAQLFDLVAGFTYTQTLLAALESGLLDRLEEGAANLADASAATGLSEDASLRLLRACSALDLAQEVAPGTWMLGERGASLAPQEGAKAMIRHHPLLYKDLADPLALLRDDRRTPTHLSEFWRYAARDHAAAEKEEAVTPYSELMAASQAMVAQEVLDTGVLSTVSSLLDIGGGHGAFVGAIRKRYPQKRLGVFDLPGVVAGTAQHLQAIDPNRETVLHGGDFFHDALPAGYDCVSLVRILHDHDDCQAEALLHSAKACLQPGQRILIAEPMAETRGARAMGDTYFGLYLWAMRSGRPRSRKEYFAMLERTGFSHCRAIATDQPIVTSVIVAFA